MTHSKKTFLFGAHQVSLETGAIARQATGAVICSMGDTVVLVTVVARQDTVEGRDFLPLTVNYQERTYAAGRIPGGFFRREGRPSEKETLTSRLIDQAAFGNWHYKQDPTHVCFFSRETFLWWARQSNCDVAFVGNDVILMRKTPAKDH